MYVYYFSCNSYVSLAKCTMVVMPSFTTFQYAFTHGIASQQRLLTAILTAVAVGDIKYFTNKYNIECSLISGALNHTNNYIIIHVKLASARCSFCLKIKSYLHSDLSL